MDDPNQSISQIRNGEEWRSCFCPDLHNYLMRVLRMSGDNGSVGAHERVAAILQGLQDSGLVLTMSPAPRDIVDSPSPMGRHETKPNIPRYSVETNTEVPSRTKTSRGAQICDDRYISCYQEAHCRARPSSPPVVISEFPPQRARPDHVEGNFEVGGIGSCDQREMRSRSPRSRLSCDRAVTNGLIPSCETDPFALSLRQYPIYPPLKSVSSEVLDRKQRDRSCSPSKTSSGQLREKILRRIQGKFSPLHNTPRTHSSLSFRKIKPSSRLRWNRSRHLLTHTYRFDSSKYRRPEKPCSFRREADASSKRQKDFGTVTKRNKDLPKTDISTTYDYLKSPRLSPTPQWRSERKVRIEEVGRQVRSAIKQMYHQRTAAFPMCPEIKKRFEDHKKNRCTANVSPNGNQQRASSSTGQGWFREILECLLPTSPCEFYDRRITNLEEEICSKFCDQESQYPAPNEDISDEVNNWLLEIPISKGESIADKRRREELANSLIVTLETMLVLCDDDYEQNAKNVIEKCVHKMPMWYTGTAQEKDQFKNQLVENLLKRVLPKPDSRLRYIAKDFVDSLNFTEEMCPNNVIDDIVKKLENFADSAPNDDKEFKTAVIREIEDLLNKLPIKLFGKRNVAINATANNLANEVMDILKTMSLDSAPKANRRSRTSSAPGRRSGSRSCSSHTIGCQYEPVLKHKKDCICLSKSSKKVYGKVGKPYCFCASYRKELRPCDCDCECDEDYYDQRINEAIADWLTNTPVQVYESPEDSLIRERLAKELGDTLKNLPLDDNVIDAAREEIKNCVHMMPMWNPGNKQDKAQLRQQLVDQLLSKIKLIFMLRFKEENKELRIKDQANEYKDQIKKAMVGDLKRILDETSLSQDEKDDLNNKLEDLINDALANGQPIAIRNMMENGIAKLIPRSSIPRHEQQSIINKMTDVVNENIDDLQLTNDNQKNVLNNMIDAIDSRHDLNKEQKNILKHKMTDLVTALDKQFMNEDQIKNQLHRIFDGSDIPEEIKRDLKDRLEKKLPNTQEQKSKAKEGILRDIVAIIEDTSIPKEIKKKLKANIEGMLTDLFQKPITRNMLKSAKEGLRQILNNAPIPTKDKTKLEQKLGKILEKNIELLVSGSGHETTKLINDIKAAIDSQDDLNEEQKRMLKNKLKDIAADLDGQFMTEGQIRDKVNKVLDETDIPKDIKHNLKDKMECMFPNLQGKKNKAKSKILRDINSVIDATNLPREIKNKLEDEIERILSDNFKKSITSNMLQDVKENVRKILNDAPIGTKDKKELEKNLGKVIENNLEPLIADNKGDRIKMLNDMIKEIELRKDLDNDEKRVLKNELVDLAATLEKEFMTADELKENMNKILDATDIPETTKRNLKNKIDENMASIKAENAFSESHSIQLEKMKIKDNILREIKPPIDETKIPKEVKIKLKDDITNFLNENFSKPLTPNILKDSYKGVRKIVNDAPISKKDKIELGQKLGTIIHKNINPLIADNSLQAKEMLNDIIAAIDLQGDLDKDQKRVLKGRLADLVASIDGQILTEDQIKDKVNEIINDTDISEAIKHNLKNEVKSAVLETKKNKAKNNILRDINLVIEDINMPGESKGKLMYDIENLLNENFSKPPTRSTLKDMRDGLQKILKGAPISKKDKTELLQKINKFMVNDMKPLLDSKEDQSTLLDDIIDAINLRDDLNEDQKIILKQKVDDLAASTEEQFLTDEEIKKKLYDIIDTTAIPATVQRKLKNDVKYIVPQSKAILQAKKNTAKDNILRDIESVIDNTNIPEEIKEKLKYDIEKLINENLNKPITPHILKHVKNELRDLLQNAPIPHKDKQILKNTLGYVMEKNFKPLIADSRGDRNKMLKDIIKEIDIRKDLNEDQKKVLKSDLAGLAAVLDEQFMTDDELKKELNQILDATDIPEFIKRNLKNKVKNIVKDKLEENAFSESPAIQLKKMKIKDNILRNINAILGKTNLPKELKQELQDKIEYLLNENFNKPLTSSILKDTTDGLRKIVNDAPISKKDKIELEQKLDRVMEKSTEPLIADINREPKKILNDIIGVIDLQEDLDEDQRMVVKNVLTDLAESLDGQFLTPDQVKDEINKTLDETDIPEDIRQNLKKQINNMISNLKGPQQVKNEAAKNIVLRDINSIIDNSNISEEIKDKLKDEIESKLTDHLNKPVTPTILKDIKEDLLQILKDSPISKKDRNDLEQKLGKVMDKTLEPLIADSRGDRTKMLNDIIKEIDLRKDMNEDQKRVLKNELVDLATLLEDQFMTDDELKEELKQILDATEIPESIKLNLKNKVDDMVLKEKSQKNAVSESPANQSKKMKIKDNILRDINAIIGKTNLPKEVKQELKDEIETLLNENFNKPLTSSILKDTIDDLRKIVNDAPLSKKDKNEIGLKLSKIMKNNVEPLIAEINREPKKILNDIIAVIDSQDNLDKDQRRIVKDVLTDLAESLEGQLFTPDQIKDKINKTLDETDIPEDIRRNLKKQIHNMISNLKVPQQVKNEAAKNNILCDINSILDNSNISEEIKDKLKDEIESKLSDHFNKPISPRILKDIKEDVLQILKDAPISTKDRSYLEQKLGKVIDKTLEPLIADSRGERTKMLNDIINEIDLREDLDEDHKRVLKNELTDLVALLEGQFMTDDELKEEVNKIIDNTDMPEDIKSNLKNEIKHTFMTKAPVQYKDQKELGPLKQAKAYKCNINPIKRNSRDIKERMGPNLQSLSSDSTRKPIKLDAKTRNAIFRSIDIIVDMLDIPCYNKLYVSDMLKAVADLDAFPDVKKKCVDVVLEYIELPAAKEAELRIILHGLFDECPCIIATYSRLGTSSSKPLNCYTQTFHHYPALYAFKKKIFNFASLSRAQDTSCDQSNENIKSIFNYDQAISIYDNIDFKPINLAIDRLPILKTQKEHAKRKIAKLIDECLSDNVSDDIMNLQDSISNTIENDLPISREKKADIKNILDDIILEHIRRTNATQEINSRQVYHVASTIRNSGRDKRKLDTKGKSSSEIQLKASDLNMLPPPEDTFRPKVQKIFNNVNTRLINDTNKAIIEFTLPKYMNAEATIKLSYNLGENNGKEPTTLVYLKDINGQREVVTNDKDHVNNKIKYNKAAKSTETPLALEDFEDLKSTNGTEGKNIQTRNNKDDSIFSNKTIPSYSMRSNPESGSERANYDTDLYDNDVQDLDHVAAASGSRTISSKDKKPDTRKGNVKESKINDSTPANDNDEDEEISNPTRSAYKVLVKDIVDDEAHTSREERPVISTPKKGRKNWDASYESPVISSPNKGRQGRYLFNEPSATSTPKKNLRSWDVPDATLFVIADDPFMKSLNQEEIDYWEQIEDAINKWMAHLTIDLDDETKDMLRQQIASDIIDRQQYLQLNPEARKSPEAEFDNLVYQVHRRLNKVLSPEEMRVAIQDGDELMSMMQEVSNPTIVHDTSIEQELHQQVEDAISDTLPTLEDTTAEELYAFESVKHKLADAFIKMQYTGGKEDERNKLKEKIKDDLNKFCDKYSAKNPYKPLDREKLNRELYEALKNLHPPNDIMHSTAKYVHAKDVVNDWAKELPLEDHNATEMKHNIGNLSRKLLDLEHNIDNLSPHELDNEKKNEINRFLKSLPFKRGQEKNKDRFTKQLLDKLKATEKTREVDASARYSITSDDFTMTKEQRQKAYPPCSLNEEDVKFLEKIRRRTCLAPKCLSTLMKNKSKSKPVSKSVTSDAQTEISGGMGLQTQTDDSVLGYNPGEVTREPPFYQEHKNSLRDVRTSYERGGNADVPLQPQVIIKEYYWDTNSSFDLPTECQTSGSANRRAPCGPTIRPWAPPPCTERHIFPRPQQSMQNSRFNPRNSVSFENEEQTRNEPFVSSGWSRASSTRDYESRINGQYSRRERITEGSLNEFRQQTYRERQPEDDGTCAINTAKGYCEDCRVESGRERVNAKEKKSGAVTCECRPKPNSGKGKKSTKSRVTCLCNNKDTEQCTQCNGNHILCPFPSYLYFAP